MIVYSDHVNNKVGFSLMPSNDEQGKLLEIHNAHIGGSGMLKCSSVVGIVG